MAKRNRRNDVTEPAPELDADTFIEPEMTPIPEPIVEVAPEPPKAAPAAPKVAPKPKVAFRVFAQVHGVKWDQMAGFTSYAKRMKLESMTIEEWRAEYKKFMGLPVGQPLT